MSDHSENSPQPEPERKPWPMKYIAVAIMLFVVIFNLYLLLTAGD